MYVTIATYTFLFHLGNRTLLWVSDYMKKYLVHFLFFNVKCTVVINENIDLVCSVN